MFEDNRKVWTAYEVNFVKENAVRMSPEEIAKELNRTATAVRQFIHRKRISTGVRVVRNLVQEMLSKRFVRPEYFKPTREFYQAVKINQKRWWTLYYGHDPLTDEEYHRLSAHFEVEIENVIKSEQLSLFDDGYSK